MIRYPNSECEKHSNVVVTEPVCLICLMDAIGLLTKANERKDIIIANMRTETFGDKSVCRWDHGMLMDDYIYCPYCGKPIEWAEGSTP